MIRVTVLNRNVTLLLGINIKFPLNIFEVLTNGYRVKRPKEFAHVFKLFFKSIIYLDKHIIPLMYMHTYGYGYEAIRCYNVFGSISFTRQFIDLSI